MNNIQESLLDRKKFKLTIEIDELQLNRLERLCELMSDRRGQAVSQTPETISSMVLDNGLDDLERLFSAEIKDSA